MKKIIKLLIILIISIIVLQTNLTLATESWDEFFLRFRNATTEGGKISDLSSEDIERMINGPTKEERESGSMYITADALEPMQEFARNAKENNAQAEIIDKKSGNTNVKDNLNNMTNKEKKEKADDLRKEIIDFLSGRDISKLSDQGIRRYLSKINQYKIYSGTKLDDTMMQYLSALNSELEARGQEKDTTIYKQQVGNDGSVEDKDGSSNDKTIGTSMGRVDRDTRHTLGEIIDEGEKFINSANEESITDENLKNMSNSIYNILLVLGIVIAIIIGGVLGIKFITEGVEGKAEVQKALIPYVIGCIVIFGAFVIWKIIVDVLQTM